MMKRVFVMLGAAVVAAGPAAAWTARSAAPSWAVGPAFDVAVSLSPKAAARLAKLKETIKVLEVVEGGAGDVGSPVLVRAEIELPGPCVAHFPGPKYDRKLMNLGVAQPLLSIDEVSGRHSSPNNLLACDDGFDDTITAVPRTIQVHCKLIGEQ
jgi:hypothetical protein